jgi:tRNA nucleotidyltransferase (CCA-adding enzyme)
MTARVIARCEINESVYQSMKRHLPRPVQMYEVGGAVRDALLGRPVADRDWLVVGATPEMMLASGYTPVGRDFPVFLHPDTHEEYALARTERKHGSGYRGFEFFASPDVTLEEDLSRRDLTINAMARGADGRLVDPHGGEGDLRAGILRHVSPAFAEDPLRVLRVARFAARFDFTVAAATRRLMRAIVAGGELVTLAPERVWQELAKGLAEAQPSRMLAVLRSCGALAVLLPEVDALFEPPVRAGTELGRALDHAAARGAELPVRYATLAQLPALPESPQQLRREQRRVDTLSARLKVPLDCRDAARLAARWRASVERAADLRPAQWLDLVTGTDALRRPDRLDQLCAVCEVNAHARPRASRSYPQSGMVREALAVVKGVDGGSAARSAGRGGPDAIAKAVRAARLEALRAWQRKLPVRSGRPPRA